MNQDEINTDAAAAGTAAASAAASAVCILPCTYTGALRSSWFHPVQGDHYELLTFPCPSKSLGHHIA